MGWNIGYRVMEEQVVELYNSGILTKELLDKVMEPYKETDCDSGGSVNLKTEDGKSVEEVICYIMKPEEYIEAVKNPVYPPDYPIPQKDKFMNSDNGYALWSSIWSDLWGIF